MLAFIFLVIGTEFFSLKVHCCSSAGPDVCPNKVTHFPTTPRILLNNSDFCTKQGRDLKILTIVHSALENFQRRVIIRDTWGSVHYFKHSSNAVLFVVGQANFSKDNETVKWEIERFGDVIQGDFVDSYRNMTEKTMMWLNWITTFCRGVKHVLKVDDDVFVNVFALRDFVMLPFERFKSKTISCFLWSGVRPQRKREDRHVVTYEEYPYNCFPPYCMGMAYLITGDLIPLLYNQATKTPYLWMDDTFITGLVPQHLTGIRHRRLNSFYVTRVDSEFEQADVGYPEDCGYDANAKLFVAELKTEAKMYQLWKELLMQQKW